MFPRRHGCTLVMAKKTGTINETKGKADPTFLKKFEGMSIVVGLPSDVLHENSGMPLSVLGAIHEFGDPENNIPQRSFLRGFLNKDETKIRKVMTDIPVKASDGGDVGMLMERAALWAQGRSQLFFVKGNKWQANAPMTVRLKGSDQPLIDKSDLRQGIIGVVLKS